MALKMMTQSELASELADRTGWNRQDAKRALSELEVIVTDNLSNCVRTKLAGVVIAPALRAKQKKRMGRNPATGEEVEIAAKPASVRVAVRPLKPLKEAVPAVRKLQTALDK